MKPITAVWEVTMGCNMRCGHCGSSCEERLPNELTTKESLDLARQISELGLRWITLSGGEPLLREDLTQIIREFVSRGVAVNIITNGWLIDAKKARELKESGVTTVAISIDGTEEIHDSIRKTGSFARIREAAKHLKASGVKMGAVTTVSNKNADVLPVMSELLPEMGFSMWQLQLGQPMGNFKERPDWVISPSLVPVLIDFCYQVSTQKRIQIFPADCLGYYTEKEVLARQNSNMGTSCWNGCNAGSRNFGILHNGDILGCTSIRQKSFIEGNIREKPLAEIWNDPEKFNWCRKMSVSKLKGDCLICMYKHRCLGGCANSRLTMNGDIYSENIYCAYNFTLKQLRERLLQENDTASLVQQAETCIAKRNYQTAAFFAARVLEIEPNNKRALMISGFTEFFCGNFELCKQANLKALELDPNDTYAMKGLGLALHKLGDTANGIKKIEQAAKLTEYKDNDILNDLNYVRQSAGLKNIAVFASHGGSNLQAIIDACNAGEIKARVCAVISNNSNSRALERARNENIPAIHLSEKMDSYIEKVLNTLLLFKADIIFLAGYLKKIPTPVLETYENKIFNIHPSLLPKYGGKGMFGINVHTAVLAAGDTETGITIHRVTADYDEGDILAQKKVPVHPNDTPETLAARVLEQEHIFLIETLKGLLNTPFSN